MTGNGHYLYDLLRRWGFTDFGARTTEFLLERPLRILVIVVVAMLAARLGSRAVERSVRSLHRRAPVRHSTDKRSETMAGVFGRLIRLVTAIVAGLMILDVVGVNLAPLIAGAGVAGIALGLGAQNLVKDMLAGLFIIGEDQYGVGDVVDLGQAAGVVEDVSLRSTRLRSADGAVWFVPNGQVQRVGNQSLDFSRAIVDVPLVYGVDLARVRDAVVAEASAFAEDPEWADRMLEPPDVWGVQSLDPSGPTMRLVVKTVPAAQGPVARALRAQILERLTRDGLRPASGA
jgi:small conductance mechanosensitive channel